MGDQKPLTQEDIEIELEKLAASYHPRYKSWTKEETELVRKYYRRVPLTKLAKMLDRTTASVRTHAEDLHDRGIELECYRELKARGIAGEKQQ